MRHATRIIATIGKNGNDARSLARIVQAGADIVRINAAHSRHGDIARHVKDAREAERILKRPVGVLVDLGGPKIRLGRLKDGEVTWKRGQTVEVVPGSFLGHAERVSVSYPALLKDVQPGHAILIADGRVRLKVVKCGRDSLFARVEAAGTARDYAGVNFPHSALSAPALTRKDLLDLAEALRARVDFVGLSFVRSAAQVLDLKRRMESLPALQRPWVVAKIERREALEALPAIAAAADALMVARGDLGVEIGLASVPREQKRILETGRLFGRPVIVATQMMESMISSPVPTRAEVTDAATAVADGADAVMLSGETAIGEFPLEAVRTLAQIATEAERTDLRPERLRSVQPRSTTTDASALGEAVSAAAFAAASRIPTSAMVVYSESGQMARQVSRHHLPIPILVLSPSEHTRRRLCILRNVTPVASRRARDMEDFRRLVDHAIRSVKELKRGQVIVEVSGAAPGSRATHGVRVRVLT